MPKPFTVPADGGRVSVHLADPASARTVIRAEILPGNAVVHHCNVFLQPRARRTLRPLANSAPGSICLTKPAPGTRR